MKTFPRIFLMTVDNNFIIITEITQNKPENNYNNNDIDSVHVFLPLASNFKYIQMFSQ